MPWRLIGLLVSTLCLLYQAVFHFSFLATAVMSGEDLITAIILLNIIALAFCVSLSIRQWFKLYRWMAVFGFMFSLLSILLLFGLLASLSAEIGDDELLNELAASINPDFLYPLIVQTLLIFIIPIWVNWPKNPEPIDEAFK